jgi:hypothetical protein
MGDREKTTERPNNVRLTLAEQIADLLYQADKGSTRVRLTELRPEGAQLVYRMHATRMVFGANDRGERITHVHVAQARELAVRDDESETAMRQARLDRARAVRVQ